MSQLLQRHLIHHNQWVCTVDGISVSIIRVCMCVYVYRIARNRGTQPSDMLEFFLALLDETHVSSLLFYVCFFFDCYRHEILREDACDKEGTLSLICAFSWDMLTPLYVPPRLHLTVTLAVLPHRHRPTPPLLVQVSVRKRACVAILVCSIVAYCPAHAPVCDWGVPPLFSLLVAAPPVLSRLSQFCNNKLVVKECSQQIDDVLLLVVCVCYVVVVAGAAAAVECTCLSQE